jgi:hypothetical protein
MLLPPPPNEIGWKETFRVNPLEQTFIALRPMLPTGTQIPFIDQVPNSVRLLDPTMMPGGLLAPPPPAGWFDPNGVAITSITNHKVNFGWEYVYHCHILAHEEMDMMHATCLALPPIAPANLAAKKQGSSTVLTWTAGGVNTTGYILQRADNVGFTAGLVTRQLGIVISFADNTVKQGKVYFYRLLARNLVGDTIVPGFPTIAADSAFSNIVQFPAAAGPTVPTAPSNLTAVAALSGRNNRITLNWTDASNNETSFTLQRALNNVFTLGLQTTTGIAANSTTLQQTVARLDGANHITYYYRIQAVNATGPSAWSNIASVVTV